MIRLEVYVCQDSAAVEQQRDWSSGALYAYVTRRTH